MPHAVKNFPVANRILAALPRAEYERLRPHLARVHFRAGHVLYDLNAPIHHVYFPTGGMVSLLSSTQAGTTVEVGMIGSEGMAGVPVVLRVNRMPYRVTTQLAADALRLRTAVLLEEFHRGARLQELLLQYMYTVLKQITQSALCHRFHTTQARLCRWLLTARDRAQTDSFPLTQESIAHMLGVPRTSVTMIASRLQRMNLISYSRGKVTIRDERRLGQVACECYGVIATELNHFLAA